jgi:hypothetical protein
MDPWQEYAARLHGLLLEAATLLQKLAEEQPASPAWNEHPRMLSRVHMALSELRPAAPASLVGAGK